jgi:FMN phosphatase YigB (HAD superfamily)
MSTRAQSRLTDFRSLKAIITDVDGTLYDLRQLRLRMVWSLLQEHAVRPALGWKTVRCLRAFRLAQEEIRWEKVGESPDPLAQFARAEQSTGYPPEFVRATVTRWMEQEPLSFIPAAALGGVRSFFSWAAGNGIQLAALSDYPLNEKLRALHLEDLFSVVVSPGHDHGLRFKPHPAILECALRRLGVEPEQAIYIGDRPDVDGAIAQRVGTLGVIMSRGRGGRSGWHKGLLYVRSFPELRIFLENNGLRS